jgi:5'-3' exonuclease
VIVPEGTFRVHLVDGTYELFRHHFGALAATRKGEAAVQESGPTRAAARGVVATVLGMLEGGATHVGVATDHVIESFRNDLWPGYKSGEGVPEELLAQFGLVEEGLRALGVTVWAMVELEADDALGTAAAFAAADPRVEQVIICTPDKDLGQSVVGTRVVQLDRRADRIIDADGVRAKFGIGPESVPDWLALVGDSADGFPGIPGWGAKSAAAVLRRYPHIDDIPDRVDDWDPALRSAVRSAARLATDLAAAREAARLFCILATLRIQPGLLTSVDELCWRGPDPAFEALSASLGAPGLWSRAQRLGQHRH